MVLLPVPEGRWGCACALARALGVARRVLLHRAQRASPASLRCLPAPETVTHALAMRTCTPMLPSSQLIRQFYANRSRFVCHSMATPMSGHQADAGSAAYRAASASLPVDRAGRQNQPGGARHSWRLPSTHVWLKHGGHPTALQDETC